MSKHIACVSCEADDQTLNKYGLCPDCVQAIEEDHKAREHEENQARRAHDLHELWSNAG